MADQLPIEKANALEVERAWVRARVRIDLEATEPDSGAGERIAFNVAVGILGQVGRWAEYAESRGLVLWTDGSYAETPGAGGNPTSIIPALRKTVPVTAELLSACRSRVGGSGAGRFVG